jgi:hypothetical protein
LTNVEEGLADLYASWSEKLEVVKDPELPLIVRINALQWIEVHCLGEIPHIKSL